MNAERFEKYNLFIRGTDPGELFSVAEQYDLLNYGILKKITQNPDQNSFQLLKSIITTTSDTELIQTCFTDLGNMSMDGNNQAINCLFELAIEFDNQQAIKQISQHHLHSNSNAINAAFYLLTHQTKALFNIHRPLYALQSYYRKCTQPIQNKMLAAAEKLSITDWHFTASLLNNHDLVTKDEFIQTYNSMSTNSKHFLLGQLIHQYISTNTKALDVLLELFFHTEETILHNFLNSKMVPSMPEENFALFLLMDEQWQKFQHVDPGNKYLQQIYQEADNYLRLKILQKTRSAGIDLVFSDVTKQQKLINLNDLSYFDWIAILNSHDTEEQRNTLWRLVQIAPPLWSSRILQKLKECQYKPINNDEQTFYESLLKVLPTLPGENETLFITERDHSISNEFQYACFQQNMSAFYSKIDNTIYLCDDLYDVKTTFRKLVPPKPLMPAIQFSSNGKYLLWADIDQMINIYERTTDRIVKRFPAHKSIIRSLITSSDQKHLFSASFDGTIQSWRFPDGYHEKEITASRNEIYSMVLSDLGNYLISGDINGTMQVISTDSMQTIHNISAGNEAILGVSTPKHQMIAAYTANNNILIWNFLSQRMLNQYEHPSSFGKITNILLTSDENILIQATNNGNLLVRDTLSGTLYEQSNFQDSPIIAVSEFKHSLWLLHKNGKAKMLNAQLLQFLLSPIKQTGDNQLRQIDELLSLPHVSTFQKKWLEFIKMLIHWQKRFDISIEEIQTSINIDDFSITI